MQAATAIANPNIAFIKYWGDRDPSLRIPSNGSISMNLDGLFTRTQVKFDPSLDEDRLLINGVVQNGMVLHRVSQHLDRIRQISVNVYFAQVVSENNFPMGTGIASSASAFSSLTFAAVTAAGLKLDEKELSRLARVGSGSACRSIPEGFVEWHPGIGDEDSYAYSIAPADHWDLTDCIAVISQEHKPTGSRQGHALAGSSPLQLARIEDARRRLEICRKAIIVRDFDTFAEIVELDSNMMHAVMMTSTPPLSYWQPATLNIMQAVQDWRRSGIPVCYTIDAGPNVHVICTGEVTTSISKRLADLPGVQEILTAKPGGGAKLSE